MTPTDAQLPGTAWLTMSDGYALRLTCFLAHTPQAVLVLHPAMGILQRYYHPFAKYMTRQGFNVVTYDYRGMGASAPSRLTPGFEVGFRQLASDAGQVMTSVHQGFPGLPLGVIGHSIGGLFPLMTSQNHLIDAYLTVGTQLADPDDFGPGLWSRLKTRALWFGLLPLLTRCYGYFPGKRFKTGLADMPARFVYELNIRRRHVTTSEFLTQVNAEDHHRSLRCRMLVLAATDDSICTERAMNRLRRHMPNTRLEQRRIRPAEVGKQAIGHVRFFNSAFTQTLWPMAANWFGQQFPTCKLVDTPAQNEYVHNTIMPTVATRNKLRITAQLIGVTDGYHIWSEKYDRELADIFDIQDEIALTILQQVNVQLLGNDPGTTLKRYTNNATAYQHYLHGRFYHNKFAGIEAYNKAIAYFQSAIDLEPTYALAYAGIASCYLNMWFYRHLPPAPKKLMNRPRNACVR